MERSQARKLELIEHAATRGLSYRALGLFVQMVLAARDAKKGAAAMVTSSDGAYRVAGASRELREAGLTGLVRGRRGNCVEIVDE